MLIHIRHAENRELVPDSLVFSFEESSLRQRFGEMARRVSGREHSGKDDDAPLFIPIAKGEHVFAGLPLSAGCRFCLRMPDAARSELHLVISPLRSLARNPEISLKINSPVRDSSLHIQYNSLTMGKIHVLCITPESLSSRSLREDLHTVVNKAPVSSLIIDNAHCFSEWGPDFRPAYLRIPQVIRDLQMQNPELTVTALSAVCSDMIRQDVLRVLKLKDMSPPPRRNFFREQISFQVITVNSPEEKIRAYEELISRYLPKLPADKGKPDPHPDIFPRYHDPYASFPDNAPAHPDNTEISSRVFPDISVSTSGKEKQEKTHIRIDTALGDSPEAWLLQTARAGWDGNRFHSVRITDLPCASCEADMRGRETRIPACSGTGCPFGKTAVCDYGRQHGFIRHQYPDPVQEIMTALHLLDFFVTGHKTGENPLRIPLSAFRQRDAEKALFHLAVIRLIDRFSIDCREEEPVFKVYGYTGSLTADTAHAGILHYFRHNDISATRRFDFRTLEELREKSGEIDRYRELHGSRVREAAASASGLNNYREYEEFFLLISNCLIPVVCHIQDELRNMAYYRLWHLKEMIKARGCRYSALLKTVQTSDEDWKCGRCDGCAPNLDFDPDSVSRPPESYRLVELEKRFSQWMENREIPFDAVSADRLIQDFGDFYDNLLIRSRKALEHNPRNIKALYVLRELSADVDKSMHTADLMRVATLDMKDLQVIRFYETSQADTALKLSMFGRMDEEYGTLHTPEGEQWLYREARNLNLSSSLIEMLKWRVMLNILAQTDFPSRNTRLKQVLKEF